MANSIDLKIYSPIEIILDEDVKKITFQGKEGYLTLLPNHIDYVSSFDTNVITYIDKENKQKFVALSNGVLTKYSNKVRLTAYKGIIGDDIQDLKKKIKELNEFEDDIEKEINKNLIQLEHYMLNNLMKMK